MTEVADRDVAPEIAAKIDQDRIDTGTRIEVLGVPIVRLDLRGVGIERESQRFDELLREPRPIHLTVSDTMRVEIAHLAVDLAFDTHSSESLALSLQAINEVRDFFA